MKLKRMRAGGSKAIVVFAVPEHRLSDQVAERFNAMARANGESLHAEVWRGMEAKRPHSEKPMCSNLDEVKAARAVLTETLAHAPDIAACSDAGLRALVEGYMRVNALCLPAGHARVEEGSEHFLFYALEARLRRGFVHGHIIGLGVALMARLQRRGGAEVVAAMRAMRLPFQPRDIGVSRETLREVLLGLRAFVAARRASLWFSVIDVEEITSEWVELAFDELQLEFSEVDVE
jgi:glycerol-1-phosphate dehydrogenase [NAD(P)+]